MKIVRKTTVGGVLVAIPAMLAAQASPEPAATPAPAEKEVVGATAEREALMKSCSAHKFESFVVLDSATNRGTRVKLCSVPGASDAEWVKTLKAAVVQIQQRRMPGAAKQQLVEELNAEIAKFDKAPTAIATLPPPDAGRAPLALPNDKFEVSTLPSLERRATPPPQERFEVAKLPPLNAPRTGAAAKPPKAMAFAVKCLARGESGTGGTCDFLEKDTVLAIRAVDGLEKGGRLRILRRGEEKAEIQLAAMEPGAVTRVGLPSSVCRGVASSKVELALVAPNATAVSARLGPFGLRC